MCYEVPDLKFCQVYRKGFNRLHILHFSVQILYKYNFVTQRLPNRDWGITQ